MSQPPRNPELERMLIDVLRATSAGSSERQGAWGVYADWLLGVGEPVGEWLAASLRADDDAEAAAPIRAQLGEIETATRFRLVDNELADLSEVPELARIAEFTWERGFITQAQFRCLNFRRFDSELLGHTPDRLLEVVLRSPSSRMLHLLALDTFEFEAKGSRYADVGALLAALREPLPLRSLLLEQPTPERQLYATLAPLRARAPRLSELTLSCFEAGPGLLEALLEAALLPQLETLAITFVGETFAAALPAMYDRFAHLRSFTLRGRELSADSIATLRELGCKVMA